MLSLPRYTTCKAFLSTLNEMNDYAGQHEVISENMTSQITVDLMRYVQELKQERKSVMSSPKRWTVVSVLLVLGKQGQKVLCKFSDHMGYTMSSTSARLHSKTLS